MINVLFSKKSDASVSDNSISEDLKNKNASSTNSKKKNKKNQKKYKFMDEIISIKSVHNKFIETSDAAVVLLSVSTPDIELMTKEEQDSFEDGLMSILMSMNFPLKFKSTTKKFSLKDFKEMIKSNDFINETTTTYREQLLNKIEEIENNKDVQIQQNYIVIYSNKFENDMDRTLRELANRLQTIRTGLITSGVKSRLLNKIEVYQLFYDQFNKNSNLLMEDILSNGSLDLYSQGFGTMYNVGESTESDADLYTINYDIEIKESEKVKDDDFIANGTTSIKDLLKPDIFDVKPDHIYFGPGRYCRMCSIANYPRFLNLGYMKEILSIGLVDVSTYIQNIPDGQVISTISTKYAKLKSNIDIKDKKGEIIDYDKLLAAQDLDHLREIIQTNSDRMFYAQTLVTIWAESLEQLQYKTTLLEDICSRRGMKARTLVKDQKPAFISALPLNKVLFKENMRNITTGAGASFFPVGNTELCHKYGVYLGDNRITSSPICFDNFLGQRDLANSNELTNPHVFTCGKAGSGKSTTMKVFIGRKQLAGQWSIILDPENEYERLVNTFGGKYITLKAGEKSGINPFEMEVEEDKSGRKSIDLFAKIAEIRTLLNSFVVEYRGNMLQGTELTTIERALKKMFSDRKITRDPDSLYEDDPMGVGKRKKKLPILSDLKMELLNYPETKELAQLMDMITGDGSMAIFDCETDPMMDVSHNPLIGINLKQLDEFTQFFAMKNILSWLWGNYSNYKYKKFFKNVWVDEGWVFAKRKENEYLEQIARRGRKYNIALFLSTQMIEEFLQNSSGKAIIQQCATKILMRQDPSVATEIANFFHLSRNSQSFINTFDKGEGLLITEREQVLLKVTLYEFEKSFATT